MSGRRRAAVPAAQGREATARQRERKRLGVAALFCLCCAGFLVVLLLQDNAEREAGSHTESLLSQVEGVSDTDPLGLAQANRGFELIGVSASGSVIGYTCEFEPDEAARQVSLFLISRGWTLLDESPTTTLSFSSERAEGRLLFVQCLSVPDGSSVVVEVL